MTLPNQPSAPQAVLDSQESFRIFQAVSGPGDIWEIDVPTRAIFIGPNSDLSEIRLQYYDKQALGADKMNTADVSVNGPFIGRLDAQLGSVSYPNINQRARILAYPVDIVDPTYVRPTGPGATPLRRFNQIPMVDLICSTNELPEIPAVRADRTLRLPRTPYQNDAGVSDDGSTDIVIPIYGRRMVTVQVVVPVLTGATISFFAAALQAGQAAFPKFLGQVAQGSTSITTTLSVVFRASDQYDMASIFGTGTTADPAMPTYDYVETIGPLSACKGMADLLIINVAPLYIVPPAGFSMIDIFVKLSDREV